MGGYPRAISRVRVVVDYANFQLCYRISLQKLKHSQNCFGLLIRGPNRLLSAKVLGLQLWRLLVCAINNYTNTVSVYSMTTLTPCMHSQQLCWRVVNDYVSKCLWSQRLPRHSIFEQYKEITFSIVFLILKSKISIQIILPCVSIVNDFTTRCWCTVVYDLADTESA